MRAIAYALDDPDLLEEAQNELARKVKAIEDSDGAGPNPISAARDVWLLRGSDEPEVRRAGELLAAVGDLRDEMRALVRRMTPAALGGDEMATLVERSSWADVARFEKWPTPAELDAAGRSRGLEGAIIRTLATRGPTTRVALAELLSHSPHAVRHALRQLEQRALIVNDEGTYRLTAALGQEASP
jgi:hypothetical protein